MSLKNNSADYELVQACVDRVMAQRRMHDLSDGFIASFSFFLFFVWLLPKIGIITPDSSVTLRSVYMIHLQRTTGEDVLPMVSYLWKWFDDAEKDASHEDFSSVELALYSVSMLICDQDHKKAFPDFLVSKDALHDILSIFAED